MLKTSLLAYILLFAFSSLFAQSTISSFDILLDGEAVGILKATKNVSDKKIVKNISSNTDAKVLLLTVHIESEIYATSGLDDILISSFAYRHANRGAEHIETTVKRLAGGKYSVVRNGVQKTLSTEGIKYCVSDLYFKEPVGLTSIFSNTHGDFVKLQLLSAGKYQLTLPDGKVNVFSYQNGKLIRVDVPMSVGNITFKRKSA